MECTYIEHTVYMYVYMPGELLLP